MVEAREAEQDPVAVWQGAAGEPGARPPRHHRDPLRMAQRHDLLHLRNTVGQHSRLRESTVRRQPVAFVRPQFFFAVQQIDAADYLAQTRQQGIAVQRREVVTVRCCAHCGVPLFDVS